MSKWVFLGVSGGGNYLGCGYLTILRSFLKRSVPAYCSISKRTDSAVVGITPAVVMRWIAISRSIGRREPMASHASATVKPALIRSRQVCSTQM